jgi:hypothetical protein
VQEYEGIAEWDVVVYACGAAPHVGRVAKVLEEAVIVEPMEEEDGGTWLLTGDQQVVEKVKIIKHVEYSYGQRQMERQVNPHAEHAEEIFTLIDFEGLTTLGE